jgi:hypothetical protein
VTARSITVAAAQLGPIQQAEPRAVVVERMQRLDDFWSPRLAVSRQGTRWLNVLKTLVTYRLITRVVRRLYRQWYEQSAMADLLGEDFALVHKDNLYRCLDKLLAHKAELFSFLRQRWETLFQAGFEILLYDLTSTYFECDPRATGKRRFGCTPLTRYPAFFGSMTRKSPVTLSQLLRQFVGTSSRRKFSVMMLKSLKEL